MELIQLVTNRHFEKQAPTGACFFVSKDTKHARSVITSSKLGSRLSLATLYLEDTNFARSVIKLSKLNFATLTRSFVCYLLDDKNLMLQ